MSPKGKPEIVAQAVALAQQGLVRQAYPLLEQAAAAGDGYAAVTLAEWRISGHLIRRDLAMARDLYGRAAALGIDEAEPIYIALLASGAGGAERQWQKALSLLTIRGSRDSLAQRQAELLAQMAPSETGEPITLPPGHELIHAPRIVRFERFLSESECGYLIERAKPVLQSSMVVHPNTGQLVRDPVRSAKSASFPFVSEDPVFHAINRRIAAVTGTSYDQGEPLQVLHYDVGDEYKLHSDALPPGNNQRVATLLVSLNADFDGGETSFPRLGMKWRGQLGEALYFQNVDHAGQPEPSAWHAGQPVRRGSKFLLSKWIRERALDLSGPSGRPF